MPMLDNYIQAWMNKFMIEYNIEAICLYLFIVSSLYLSSHLTFFLYNLCRPPKCIMSITLCNWRNQFKARLSPIPGVKSRMCTHNRFPVLVSGGLSTERTFCRGYSGSVDPLHSRPRTRHTGRSGRRGWGTHLYITTGWWSLSRLPSTCAPATSSLSSYLAASAKSAVVSANCDFEGNYFADIV